MLTSLPQGVVEIIVSHLWGDDKVGALPVPQQQRGLCLWVNSPLKRFGMQAHLALSCKALLPILGMGHVRLNADEPNSLLNATRCLKEQPSGASHLEVFSEIGNYRGKLTFATRRLIDLRSAHQPYGAGACMGEAPAMPWPYSTREETDANAAVRVCSLLTNLRKLTLDDVAVSLPALQPIATRLHELRMIGSRLQDSADGFLTRGWTALTTLCLTHTLVENATMAAQLELPALEELDISGSGTKVGCCTWTSSLAAAQTSEGSGSSLTATWRRTERAEGCAAAS